MLHRRHDGADDFGQKHQRAPAASRPMNTPLAHACSTYPMIDASTGTNVSGQASAASRPSTKCTRSPGPVDTTAHATSASPIDSPRSSSGWIHCNAMPSSPSYFCVATTRPITRARYTSAPLLVDVTRAEIPRIDDGHDHRVARAVLGQRRLTRARARRVQDHVLVSGADRVDRDHVLVLRLVVLVVHLDEQELAVLELLVLAR